MERDGCCASALQPEPLKVELAVVFCGFAASFFYLSLEALSQIWGEYLTPSKFFQHRT